MPEINPAQTRIINDFVDKLIAEKGLGAASAEEVATLRGSVRADLEREVEQAVLRALSDEQLLALEKMVGDGVSDEELDAFFEGSGVEFTKVAGQAMQEFREAFLSDKAGEEK